MRRNKIGKKLCLLFVLIAVLLCGGVLSSCGEKPDEGEKTVVTYYLYNDVTPMTAVIFDGSFTFDRIPQKDHCAFLGLFDDKIGGTKIVDEYGRCNIVIQSDITLWAHWQGNNCDITFDAGDGTLPSGSQSMSLVYGSVVPDFPVPELEGYTFVGWTSKENLVSDGATPKNTVFDDSGYTFEPNSDTVLLVAKYEVKHFTLTLDYNDSTYRTDTRTVRYGDALESVDLPQADTGKSEIVGWSTERNRNIPFTGTFSSDITLYAVWKDYKVFRFYTDSETYTEHKVYRDEEYEIPDVEKTGYRLDGWYASQTFSGNPVKRVSYGSAVISYYAKWEAIEYHITFFVDGGDAVLGNRSYTIEQEVVLPDAGNKQYCVFAGWCKNEDRSDTPFYILPQGTYGDITLYAKWKGEGRTVILDPNEGYLQNDRYTIEYGALFRLPVPVKEGYDFLGWYTNGEIKMTDESGSGLEEFEIAEQETTLYAHWQIKVYSVEYQTNGGSDVPAQKYEHGTKLKFPDPPTKQNMELEGWYLDADFSLRVEEETPVLGDMTLYAKWYQMTAIHNVDDLKAIFQHPDYNYYLAEDINMGADNWTPIENFSGTLDGKRHKIYNFTISSTSTVANLGFFAVNHGVIKNVILESVVFNYTTTSTTNAGVFVGINNGELTNCVLNKSDLTIHGNFWNVNSHELRFGGIIGENNGNVQNCSVTETEVTATHDSSANSSKGNYINSFYLGGLIGIDDGQTSDCYSNLEINVTQSSSNQYSSMLYSSDAKPQSSLYVGGIVGKQSENGSSNNCFSESPITVNLGNCYSYYWKDWYGTFSCAGGIAGIANGSIETCKATCTLDVATVNVEGNVGGLVGSSCGNINNSYALSTIKVDRSGEVQVAGGFVGVNQGAVRNCYSAGIICSQKGSMGGFCGKNMGTGVINRCFSITKFECGGENVAKFNADNAGTISNCYYADTVGSGTYAKDVASEKSSDHILRSAFLIDELYWDSEVWTVDENGETPPRLKWESE